MEPISTTSIVKITLPFIKKPVDDIYDYLKTVAVGKYVGWRAKINDQVLHKKLTRVTYVKTLWNVERESSIGSFYYPSKLEFQKGVIKSISGLKDLGRQNCVIQGTAGQGKSIFLRYLSGQELKVKSSTGRVPVFLELRNVKQFHSLVGALCHVLDAAGLSCSEGDFSSIVESGKLVLFLDAFDEIDADIVERVFGEVERLAQKYSESLQIVVSARPDSHIQLSSYFRVFKLHPLERNDHLPFLVKVCPSQEEANNLHEAIARSKAGVWQLLTTPLMMTLLVVLYKSVQAIPESVPRFYEELFDVLFYRHDRSKPGFSRKRYTNLQDAKIKSLFSAFCFYSRIKGYVTFSSAQVEECILLAEKACDVKVDSKGFRDEIVKTICLMLEDGLVYSFIHRSVSEYYAASFVSKSGEEFAVKFYAKLLSSSSLLESWSLSMRFLADIDTFRYSKYFVLPTLFSIDFEDGESERKYLDMLDNSWVSYDEGEFSGTRMLLHGNDIVDRVLESGMRGMMGVLLKKKDFSALGKDIPWDTGLPRDGSDSEKTRYIKVVDVWKLLPETKDEFMRDFRGEIGRVKAGADAVIATEKKKTSSIDELLP